MPHEIRFGSWLRTINFCHWHFLAVFNFIVELQPERSTKKATTSEPATSRVNQLKQFATDVSRVTLLHECIEFIFESYSELPMYIYKLEQEKLLLVEAFHWLEQVKETLKHATANATDKFKTSSVSILAKFEHDLDNNTGMWQMLAEVEQDQQSVYKYAPLNSCGCERMLARFRLDCCQPNVNLSPEQVKMRTAIKGSFRVAPGGEEETNEAAPLDDDEERDEDVDYWELDQVNSIFIAL